MDVIYKNSAPQKKLNYNNNNVYQWRLSRKNTSWQNSQNQINIRNGCICLFAKYAWDFEYNIDISNNRNAQILELLLINMWKEDKDIVLLIYFTLILCVYFFKIFRLDFILLFWAQKDKFERVKQQRHTCKSCIVPLTVF